jgi:ketosteroid isomerase-like protein
MTDTIALIREWLELVASGPAEAWAGKVAENIVIRLPYAPPGVAKELRGMKAAIEAMGPSWAAKHSFAWHDVRIRRTEEPDLFLTTARSEVALASGKRYANDYVMLTRIRDGKVEEHIEYFDPLKVIEAYGIGA